MKPVHVRVFYPADPVGVVPGGVDTFMRGLLKHAPADIRFSVVGMTTNPAERPLKQWSTCRAGSREFNFFPVVRVADAGQRSRIPLSVRYTSAVLAQGSRLRCGFDVLDLHRVEPGLLFLRDKRPMNAFFHQDMGVIRSSKADILWRRLPALYFALERRVFSRLSSAWCVREEGVRAMRKRYPAQAGRIRFVPTWVDTEVFHPVSAAQRALLRREWAERAACGEQGVWMLSVGRLDSQKDPEMMWHAFNQAKQREPGLIWLVVGDGVLRSRLHRLVVDAGQQASVRFLGLQAPAAIADLMRCCDLYALSSAYEGMPMAVLEALGCGLPVATTDVGEVRKVVLPGINGEISADHSAQAFAQCLLQVAAQRPRWSGPPAVAAIQAYRPAQVLQPVYENYRTLGTATAAHS